MRGWRGKVAAAEDQCHLLAGGCGGSPRAGARRAVASGPPKQEDLCGKFPEGYPFIPEENCVTAEEERKVKGLGDSLSLTCLFPGGWEEEGLMTGLCL